MKTILRICHGDRQQDYSESDLPLAVSVSSGDGVLFGSAAESDPAAWFGLNNHYIFVQPEPDAVLIQLNGKKLNDSVWLSADDEFEIDNTRYTVRIDSGVVVLSFTPERKVPVLIPPEKPLTPTEQTEDVTSLPSDKDAIEPEQPENIPTHNQPEVFPDASLPRLPGKHISPRLRNSIIGFFVFLLFCVIFVLVAVPVRVSITPAPDTFSLKGFPPPVKIGAQYLTLPGSYHVVAWKEGYHKLDELIKVKYGSESSPAYTLLELPGLLEVVSHPVTGAEVMTDGTIAGNTPLSAIKLEAGSHEIIITAPRYLPDVQLVEIKGLGVRQSIDVTLQPGWGTLRVESEPEAADVWLNGVAVGQTPLETEPMAGVYKVELRKDGWQPVAANIKIEPGVTLSMPVFKLQKINGTLELTSGPSGASVMLNSEFRGYTPITLAMSPEKEHQLSLSKNGFITVSRSIRVEPDKTKPMDIQLEAEYGVVFITSQPADAELTVDGIKVNGFASQRLRLTALPHQIKVSKTGYETFVTNVTPTASVSKRVNVQLRSDRQVKAETVVPEIKTSEGQLFIRVILTEPVQIQMGASRRESGRRSNETQYRVELTRSFAISEKEVTNAEYQKFRQEHNSGRENGFNLNEMDQPVTSVTWNQAAEYLNWLSQKDGLPPVYEENGGEMVAIVPVTTGYRLPTEAEWAFVARYEGDAPEGKKPLKYPWGSGHNPPAKTGNYADNSAMGSVPVTIKDYVDGYRVASPVGKFPPNSLSIYDLGGNVSEWCHDYYDVHLDSHSKVLRDPIGPAAGKYHVVRGASWRHGSITELRLSYRDYTEKARNDLGFRIARYAE